MAKISLSPYTIRVKHKETNENIKLDQIEGRDLLEILKEYLEQIQSIASVNQDTSKVIKLKDNIYNNRTNRGILETGEYGYETELYDTQTDRVTYSRKVHEAELIPFYYILSIPNKRDEGVVILQRFKQFGIRKIFLDDFEKYFNKKYPEYRISINPLIASEILDQYFQDGRLTKIRFVKFKLPKNIEDIFAGEDHKESPGYLEHVVSLRRGREFSHEFYNKLKKGVSSLFNGSTRISEIEELQELQEYDNVKLEIKIGNSPRVVDLGRINKLRYSEDVSDKIIINSNGHPRFESIDKEANSLLEALSNSIWGMHNDQ